MTGTLRKRISSDVLAGSLPGNAYVAPMLIKRTFFEWSDAAVARIPGRSVLEIILGALGLEPLQLHFLRARLPSTSPAQRLSAIAAG